MLLSSLGNSNLLICSLFFFFFASCSSSSSSFSFHYSLTHFNLCYLFVYYFWPVCPPPIIYPMLCCFSCSVVSTGLTVVMLSIIFIVCCHCHYHSNIFFRTASGCYTCIVLCFGVNTVDYSWSLIKAAKPRRWRSIGPVTWLWLPDISVSVSTSSSLKEAVHYEIKTKKTTIRQSLRRI